MNESWLSKFDGVCSCCRSTFAAKTLVNVHRAQVGTILGHPINQYIMKCRSCSNMIVFRTSIHGGINSTKGLVRADDQPPVAQVDKNTVNPSTENNIAANSSTNLTKRLKKNNHKTTTRVIKTKSKSKHSPPKRKNLSAKRQRSKVLDAKTIKRLHLEAIEREQRRFKRICTESIFKKRR